MLTQGPPPKHGRAPGVCIRPFIADHSVNCLRAFKRLRDQRDLVPVLEDALQLLAGVDEGIVKASDIPCRSVRLEWVVQMDCAVMLAFQARWKYRGPCADMYIAYDASPQGDQ